MSESQPFSEPLDDILGRIADLRSVAAVRSSCVNQPLTLHADGTIRFADGTQTSITMDFPEVLGAVDQVLIAADRTTGTITAVGTDRHTTNAAVGRAYLAGRLVCVLGAAAVHSWEVTREGHLSAQPPMRLDEFEPPATVDVIDNGRLAWVIPGTTSQEGVCVQIAPAERTLHHTTFPIPVHGCAQASVSPGGHAVLIRDSEGEYWITPLSEKAELRSVGCATTPPVWTGNDAVAWLEPDWPFPQLVRADMGGRISEETVPWTVAKLFPSPEGAYAVATRPGAPAALRPLAALLQPGHQHPLPAFRTGTLETEGGSLRVIDFPPATPTRATAVMLRGGPYGNWTPTYDPMVELLHHRGIRVVQLESPYTASVHKRLPAFRRAEFGTRDARLVAQAAQQLRDMSSQTPLILIGHSYGAYLAAAAARRMAGDVDALATMNGPWTTTDLLRLARDSTDPAARSLGDFIRRAFGTTDGPPPAELAEHGLPHHWLVQHGMDDPLFTSAVALEAITRDQPRHVLSLDGEGHIPTSPDSITAVIVAMNSWLENLWEDTHDRH